MKIVTLGEFCKMPIGTLFVFNNSRDHKELYIKEREPQGVNGYIGFISGKMLTPYVNLKSIDEISGLGEYSISYATRIWSIEDFDEDTFFRVFEKQEVKELIDYLENALRLGYSEGEV